MNYEQTLNKLLEYGFKECEKDEYGFYIVSTITSNTHYLTVDYLTKPTYSTGMVGMTLEYRDLFSIIVWKEENVDGVNIYYAGSAQLQTISIDKLFEIIKPLVPCKACGRRD